MKLNKKSLRFIVFAIIAVIIVALGLVLTHLLKNDDKEYVLIYDMYKESYSIYVTKDNVKVESLTEVQCVKAPCEKVKDSYKPKLDKENIEKLYDLAEKLAKKDGGTQVTLDVNTLSAFELQLIYAAIYKDQSFIDAYNDSDNLLFSIQSNRIKCPTVSLSLYKDGTYEYYKNISKDNIEPLKGTYQYDASKIVDNADSYEKLDNDGSYVITFNDGKTINIYANNKELQELLTEINLNLDVCALIMEN